MSTFIKPDSVNSYLSEVANQLEPFSPHIRAHRNSNLVKCTVAGCHRRFGSPIKHKRPLSKSDLKVVIEKLGMSFLHDEKLFLATLLTGFHGLMRLGELCFPDRVALRNYKVSLHHTVLLNGCDTTLSFSLVTRGGLTASMKATQLSSRILML
jgi:hypothetical protein